MSIFLFRNCKQWEKWVRWVQWVQGSVWRGPTFNSKKREKVHTYVSSGCPPHVLPCKQFFSCSIINILQWLQLFIGCINTHRPFCRLIHISYLIHIRLSRILLRREILASTAISIFTMYATADCPIPAQNLTVRKLMKYWQGMKIIQVAGKSIEFIFPSNVHFSFKPPIYHSFPRSEWFLS